MERSTYILAIILKIIAVVADPGYSSPPPAIVIHSGVSRLTRVEKAVKNTTIIVIYKLLVYIQMSQPATCFGLF